MIAVARGQFVRISPRKVRYVIDHLRRKSVSEAHGILNGSPRRAADIIRKLLNQAVDAAEKNSRLHAGDLMISKITADEGPTKVGRRWRATAMGRGVRYRKRQTHLTVHLEGKKHGA